MCRFEFGLTALAGGFFGFAGYCVAEMSRPEPAAAVEYRLNPRDQQELARLAERLRVAEAENRTLLLMLQASELRRPGAPDRPVQWPQSILPTVEVPQGDRIPPQNVPVPLPEERP